MMRNSLPSLEFPLASRKTKLKLDAHCTRSNSHCTSDSSADIHPNVRWLVRCSRLTINPCVHSTRSHVLQNQIRYGLKHSLSRTLIPNPMIIFNPKGITQNHCEINDVICNKQSVLQQICLTADAICRRKLVLMLFIYYCISIASWRGVRGPNSSSMKTASFPISLFSCSICH